MSEETVINPSLKTPGGVGKTLVNPALPSARTDEKTLLNVEALRVEGLRPGMKLRGGVTIEKKLDVPSGEADLYLCEYQGRKMVLKHYRQAQSLKKEVTEALKAIRSEYVARVYAVGTFLERNYEIDAYFPLGSLDGAKVPYEKIKSKIIPQLNEGLRALHQKGLLHKDLKPSNIMLRTEQYDIALIDFGISSILESDSTVLLTQTGMTPQYAAPETMQGMYMEESDYYSMGITLCALYQGHSPFYGMDAQEISRFIAIQRLPLPEDMPYDLQELILGLTYVDVTNRNDKNNPNRRWTYEEVKKWIAGERQSVPGDPGAAFLQDAEFAGKTFADQASLTEEMIADWDLGKKMLVSGDLARMFRRCAPSSAPLCASAQEKAKAMGGYDDLAYFFLLYYLMESRERFVWKGRAYENTVALGSDMLSRLQAGDETDARAYAAMLRQKILSAYARLNGIVDSPQLTVIREAENDAARADIAKAALKRLYYRVAFLLSGQKKLVVDGETFFSMDALAAHAQALASRSLDDFRRFCRLLIRDDSTLDPQFETWLEATGYAGALEAWRLAMQESSG